VLRREVAYRALADQFKTQFAPSYAALIKDAETQKLDLEIVRARLGEIEEALAARLSAYPLAGLFNHVGNLAMTRGDSERALGRFYTGIAIDPEHVPLYESIAYASWAINQEAPTAIRYAAAGLERSRRFLAGVKAEYEETIANYSSLTARYPALAPRLDTSRNLLQARAEGVSLGGHLKTGQSWTGQNRPVR